MTKTFIAVFFALCSVTATAEDAAKPLYSSTSGNPDFSTIEGLMVDYSSASVSAADLVAIGGDSTKVVENIRDFTVAFKALDGSHPAFGFSITPARSALRFPRMSLQQYMDNWMWRVLGSLTVGYAQGKSTIASQDYFRRAVSVETSVFFHNEDDPITAVAGCAEKGVAAMNASGPVRTTPGTLTSTTPDTASAESVKRGTDAYNECATAALKLSVDKWNKSKGSFSFATGRVRRDDGAGDDLGLGRTFAAGFVYGFDNVPTLNQAAITLVARRSYGEPVLATLGTTNALKDSSLVALRLSGGSSVFRGLVEVSNTKATDVTLTQTVFKRAIGIDWRVHDGIWLALRSGKRQKVDGTGEENASMLSLSYSPKPTLGH